MLLHEAPETKPARARRNRHTGHDRIRNDEGCLGPRVVQRRLRHGQRHPEELEKPVAHEQHDQAMAEVRLGAHGLGAALAQKLARRGSQSPGHEREALHVDEGLSRLPVVYGLPRHVDAPGQLALGDTRRLAELPDAGTDDLPRCTPLVHVASSGQAYPHMRR